jgi:preprotein translocase subunit SecD
VAINPRSRRSVRTLSLLAVVTIALYALMAALHVWGGGQLTPKLGLDLDGGTEIVLAPQVAGGKSVNPQQITQAVDIIRQRVDGAGVSEAEVVPQSGRNIVVSIPGRRLPEDTKQALERSSQLRFRAVLCEGSPAAGPAPSAGASGGGTASPSGSSSPSASSGSPSSSAPAAPGSSATSAPSAPSASSGSSSASRSGTTSSRSHQRAALIDGLPAATTSPTSKPKSGASATSSSGSASTSGSSASGSSAPASSTASDPSCPATTSKAAPKDGSDPAWVTPQLAKAFTDYGCKSQTQLSTVPDDPSKPLVTCNRDGTVKFLLGPAEITGTQVTNASSGLQTSSQGATTGEYEVRLQFDSVGADRFGAITGRLVSLPDPRNLFSIVLDGQVISYAKPESAITGGSASITGGFTSKSAIALAQQLKFGALPMSFAVQTSDDVSPTLGSEQLQRGLLAGLIGLLLVVVYSLFQYRALGLVTIASLLIAAALTYALVVLLGQAQNFSLTLAGVTGLIVSIGITADSFIVFFERVRDEVREGRPLRAAVEAGWKRARRTILVADGVNLLAAVVLYVLAASNVRGFAYTLGLTTLIDVGVVILFTHPMVALLANTRFFGGGHRWSGLDPERLGSKVPMYAGRGRVRGGASAATPPVPARPAIRPVGGGGRAAGAVRTTGPGGGAQL